MKKLFNQYLSILFAGSLALSITACSDDEPEPLEEQELITTMTITFETAPGVKNQETITATFRDIDGPGGNPPTSPQVISLAPETPYLVSITLLDESSTPATDITAEVEEEKEDHQFFYQSLDGLNLTVNATDFDDNNLPVGLEAEAQTGAESEGQLRVTLKHLPNQKSRNSTVATGETDIQVDFPITIEQ